MYVIETMLPDGPHWYAGIRVVRKNDKEISSPEWTPYFEDRKVFEFVDLGLVIASTVCSSMDGATVIPEGAALKDESRWHNNGRYYMRAKYLSKGMQVGVANTAGEFTVILVSHKYIMLKQGERKVKIPKNSPIWVEIIGKRKTELNDNA